MEQLYKRVMDRKKIQNSLNELEDAVLNDNHANESLLRLSRALKDINEEVNLMKSIIQNNE
ncbi:MAG: hypothetical protein MJK12_12780 [Colwellia sp.]|nr:hypothetical protein [Colwellia sp.]